MQKFKYDAVNYEGIQNRQIKIFVHSTIAAHFKKSILFYRLYFYNQLSKHA